MPVLHDLADDTLSGVLGDAEFNGSRDVQGSSYVGLTFARSLRSRARQSVDLSVAVSTLGAYSALRDSGLTLAPTIP